MVFEDPTSKKCPSHCPNCDAGDDDIEWGLFVFDEASYQPATCNKCGCEFKEYYQYSDTEFDVGAVPRIPCKTPLNQFYNFIDEVPDGRVSTSEDCTKCDEEQCDLKHCFIIDGVPHYPMEKQEKKDV